MTRQSHITRKTLETEVAVRLGLDGGGVATVTTGVGFFDHLLDSFAHHGLFDLDVTTEGDLHIDEHHTVEDTAIALGEAFAAALGDRAGIQRFGSASVPMDEALATATVDVGGRPYCVVDIEFRHHKVGDLGTQMIEHLLESFATSAGFTVHLNGRGRNDHHIAEAVFKALARALREAVAIDDRRTGLASTKGPVG